MRVSKRDTEIKNRRLDSVGEGEGEMIWENSIETCILQYVKQITSPGSMHETGCSGLVHWGDPEGWDGEGGGFRMGTHVHPWLIHVNVWQNPHYCKIISLQSKKINNLKNWFVKLSLFKMYNSEWNNAICSNMDGQRDDHTKWRQPKTNSYCYWLPW